jgi:hypothetical protein
MSRRAVGAAREFAFVGCEFAALVCPIRVSVGAAGIEPDRATKSMVARANGER